jgi:predicted pyridoxine 5'-phosphate oxidase superfamily flavin-nucleotide-binding protein
MGIALSDEVKQLVDRPNFAHLATIMTDGPPQSAPVWITREGNFLLVCTEASSLKGRNTLRDARISISMVDFVALRVTHASCETDQSKNSNCVLERFDHV